MFYLEKGTKVIIHYAKRKEPMVKKRYRDAVGKVITMGKGPGPRNVLVNVDGKKVVVPRGNVRIYSKEE